MFNTLKPYIILHSVKWTLGLKCILVKQIRPVLPSYFPTFHLSAPPHSVQYVSKGISQKRPVFVFNKRPNHTEKTGQSMLFEGRMPLHALGFTFSVQKFCKNCNDEETLWVCVHECVYVWGGTGQFRGELVWMSSILQSDGCSWFVGGWSIAQQQLKDKQDILNRTIDVNLLEINSEPHGIVCNQQDNKSLTCGCTAQTWRGKCAQSCGRRLNYSKYIYMHICFFKECKVSDSSCFLQQLYQTALSEHAWTWVC